MGIANIFGNAARAGGVAATLMGLPMVGIPLALAGGALAGGSQRKKPIEVPRFPSGPGDVPEPPTLEAAGGGGGS